MRKLTSQDIEDRAVKEPMSGCWIWMGYMNANGYGIAGTSKLAHRVSYEYAVGEIPKGLDLMHLCHNRACVNPEHLKPGTRRENVMMSVNDGRWNNELRSKNQAEVLRRKTRSGLIIGRRAKFTDAQVKGIRKLVDFGIDKKLIGNSLGVTCQAINQIHKRKAYAYVC